MDGYDFLVAVAVYLKQSRKACGKERPRFTKRRTEGLKCNVPGRPRANPRSEGPCDALSAHSRQDTINDAKCSRELLAVRRIPKARITIIR